MDDKKRLRSEDWFNNLSDPKITALYLERYLNYGLTRDELQSGRPLIGIAQTGSDISPCNRIHLQTAERARDGIRDAGGIPFVFPMHPIQESCRRPTSGLDRNLAYLGLVEIMRGYPFDGIVLTTGCDKTTPAALMAAATVNLPSIVLSGGPMVDSYLDGRLAGAGTVIWEARKRLAAGEIDYDGFMMMLESTTLSPGHCNTMGTALTMNCLAEALGMSLPGCAGIPAPFRQRGQMAYQTGRRIVEMVHEDLRPSEIMTREAFENVVVVNSAIGGSTNAPPHIQAIAKHMGVEMVVEDWQEIGYEIPLLVNCQPTGDFLGEGFHRAGAVPAVMLELLQAGRIHGGCKTVSGKSVADNIAGRESLDRQVIMPFESPLMPQAGFMVLSGNLFDAALMKTSGISAKFRKRYLCEPGNENCFDARAIVFEGPEDYHDRINDAALMIDDSCILVIRGCGPIGYPGSAEVVNMQPPDEMIAAGISELPTMGDGRQSGTSSSPSILNASPESLAGGNLALLETGDMIRFDLNNSRVELLISEHELHARRDAYQPPELINGSPWEELSRTYTGQLSDGACLDFATAYRSLGDEPLRHSH
ncbi:IlvD/Edd family dehydratase [Rosistilla oblonga]|uniref:IlvD/Edd family dehydratase n=1 Tax=Rosistilla oblonga TaxID=2527990 RepID=UPI003A97F803